MKIRALKNPNKERKEKKLARFHYFVPIEDKEMFRVKLRAHNAYMNDFFYNCIYAFMTENEDFMVFFYKYIAKNKHKKTHYEIGKGSRFTNIIKKIKKGQLVSDNLSSELSDDERKELFSLIEDQTVFFDLLNENEKEEK